jgi:hypothetical protein
MYVVVHHHISDPDRFWPQVQQATPDLPQDLTIHLCLPTRDGREAACVWEGPSLDEVREAVEGVVGAYSRNEYFEAEAKEGINLPTAVTARS